jgi:mono/diheme cytochrome c family protein
MRQAPSAQGLHAVAFACACACGILFADVASAADEATRGLSPAMAAKITDLMPQGPLPSGGEGRRTFLKLNCYGCHGSFAEGSIGPPLAGVSRGEVAFNVMNGNDEGMPSFAAYVDDTDIDNLTNYFADIGTPNEWRFMDWWKKFPRK